MTFQEVFHIYVQTFKELCCSEFLLYGKHMKYLVLIDEML